MGEAAGGGRSSDRPPFVPSLTWQPNLIAESPYAGYSHFVADLDDDRGTYAQMFRPGAKGAAMMVTAINPWVCCSQTDLRSVYALDTLGEDKLVPLLLPGVVKWRSLVGDDGYLLEGIAKDWDMSLVFPPVGIYDYQFIDCTWLTAACNVVLPDDCMDIDDVYSVGPNDWVHGVVAPWQLLPISPTAEQMLLESLRAAPVRWNTHVLGYTNCEMGEQAYDSVEGDWYVPGSEADPGSSTEWGHAFHHGHPECEWLPGRPECVCGEPPTMSQALEGLITAFARPHGVEQLLVPQPLRPAWRTAQARFNDAWETVEHRGRVLGDKWSTSCSLRLSPYWDSSTHELQRLALSLPSTTSPTLLASSAESSQLSMQYG